MKKILHLFAIMLACSTFADAHIGSSGVLMQAQAGPYQVLIDVKPPDVIPGTAKITVFVQNGSPRKLLVRPVYFLSGSQGSPSSDQIQPVPNQPGQFSGEVWLMETGSSGIQLEILGKEGKGEFTVPILAVSTAQRAMPPGLGFGLSILAIFLFLLMITAIGASVSDGILDAGQLLSAAHKRKKMLNMGIATLVCAVILFAGSSWWNRWEANYKSYLYKPLQGSSVIIQQKDQRIFQLKIDTTKSETASMLNTLIPDHGKLMHAFLVRTPGLDAFAHIHPERKDIATFESLLPDLPAGKYLVYADIVQYSGFAETIVDTLLITEPLVKNKNIKKTAEEDSYIVTGTINTAGKITPADNVVICGKPGTRTVFSDGSFAVWEGKPDRPLQTGKPYALNFTVFNPDGTPAQLEPYLGMMGHAAILNSDGSVYIHLHPGGTFAMAAGQTLKDRVKDTTQISRKPSPVVFRDSIDRYLANLKTMPLAEREAVLMAEMHSEIKGKDVTNKMDHANLVSFPYAFPKSGQYRIFVQIKRKGQVLTGAFDANVSDAAAL